MKILKEEISHCPKCKNKLTRRKKFDNVKNIDSIKRDKNQRYVFTEYDRCTNCNYIQLYEHYKMDYDLFMENLLKGRRTLF